MTGDSERAHVAVVVSVRRGDAGAVDRRRIHAAARRQVRPRRTTPSAGSMTMTLWAVVCVVCFVITFATTRERIQPPPQQKSDAASDFKNLLKNGPWIAMFVLTLVALHLRGDARRHDVLLLQLLRRPGAARSSSSSGSACRRRRPRCRWRPLRDERARADPQRRSHRTSRRSDSACSTSRARSSPSSASSLSTYPRDALRQARGGARRVLADDDLPGGVHSSAGGRRSGRRTGSSSCARCATRRRFRSSGRCSPTSPTTRNGRRAAGRRASSSRRFSSR